MPSNELSRRRFAGTLTTLVFAALAGCSGVSLADSDDESRSLRILAHEHEGPLRNSYVHDLEATSPTWDERAFDAAHRGENFTMQYRHPFPHRQNEPSYARRDGTYYHLDELVVGQERVTHPVVRLFEAVESTDDADAPEYVGVEKLPSGDQTAIEIASRAARARGNVGGGPGPVVQIGGYVFRNEDVIDESELLTEDGPTHIAYRGTVYRMRIAKEVFHEPIYRPDVDPVAESKAEMESILQAELVDTYLSSGDLSSEERGIIIEALDDGYRAEHPFSDSLRSFLRKIDERAYVDGNVEKDALIETGAQRLLKLSDRYVWYRLRLEDE